VRTLGFPPHRRALVDTSAYYALVDDDDVYHVRANAIGAALRGRLYTTNLILAETHALLLRRLGRETAAQFLIASYQTRTNFARVTWADEQRAIEIITTHDDKDYSLTDATSFAVMERLGITTAFTFDRHFAQYGFMVLGLGEP
jgi:predicted nucleic acid-binding protein